MYRYDYAKLAVAHCTEFEDFILGNHFIQEMVLDRKLKTKRRKKGHLCSNRLLVRNLPHKEEPQSLNYS